MNGASKGKQIPSAWLRTCLSLVTRLVSLLSAERESRSSSSSPRATCILLSMLSHASDPACDKP